MKSSLSVCLSCPYYIRTKAFATSKAVKPLFMTSNVVPIFEPDYEVQYVKDICGLVEPMTIGSEEFRTPDDCPMKLEHVYLNSIRPLWAYMK